MPDAARQVILTAQGGTEKPSQLYVLYFTSRNPKSNWSSANRQRVERMMEQGRMTEADLGLVKLATESGAWTALQEVQESVIPPDLSEALAAGHKAEEDRGDGAPRRAEH